MKSRAIFGCFLTLLFLSIQAGSCERSPTPSQLNQVNATDLSFHVHGMTCGSCESIIQNGLRGIDGIYEVKASSAKHLVFVRFDNKKLTEDQLIKAITDLGYQVEDDDHHH